VRCGGSQVCEWLPQQPDRPRSPRVLGHAASRAISHSSAWRAGTRDLAAAGDDAPVLPAACAEVRAAAGDHIRAGDPVCGAISSAQIRQPGAGGPDGI